MNTESSLRILRRLSIAVTIFSAILLAAGLAEIGLGGVAVKRQYDQLAAIEQRAREASPYYYDRSPYRETQDAYRRSSTGFITRGFFETRPDAPGIGIPALVAFVTMLVAVLGFWVSALAWVWQAHTNLAKAGIRASYGPVKAVVAYILPIANLFMPFEAMRELYNRSHGEPDELADATVEDVTAWWVAMVISLLIFTAVMIKFAFDLGSRLIIMTPLWMEYAILSFAVILLLGSTYLFSRLVRAITQAQRDYLPTLPPDQQRLEEAARPTVRIIGE